jgi:NAD(P)H-quinone oxidoreductase subunit 5
MTNENQNILTAGIAASSPLALMAFGLLPEPWLKLNGIRAARTGAGASLAAFALALLAAASRVFVGEAKVEWPIFGDFYLGIYFDNLAVVLLVLVSFLLAVIARFSINYLAGDPAQGRFTRWLCLTGGSALAMVISGNLVQFALTWCATSLCLHQLLLFYPDRPGAVLAARKKFIISRLGDVCLLIVIVLVHQTFHSWNFPALFKASKQLHETGVVPGRLEINAICFLLVAGAMLKSAQFPFHSWLPDTMETPTPVSALMHAGIINAGGYLIIRLNPLVTLVPAALSTLALCGAFTALFASLVMLTHASVKRSLAFSTVAQMGFMMLECGLGAFDLAVLHLVAHALYKAHAFLSSGSIVRLTKSTWTPAEKPNAHLPTLVAAFAAAGALVPGLAWVLGVNFRHEPALFVLGCTFAMALAYALWNLWSQSLNLTLAAFGGIIGSGIVSAYFVLHKISGWLIGQNEWINSQLNTWPGALLIATLLALFLVVLILQTELPAWTNHPFFLAIYVHARNGFYFNTLANRLVAAVWPVKSPRP